ncbi:MAG: thioesterase [Anaerolineae bacterium]|nr:thioesterase [Anaerolineae bacterium]MDW8298899.1 thioesterase [Anaerolineae bacterium]
MPKVYSWQFAVRTYEVGATETVRLPVYLNYLEEAATQASAWCGYDYYWYRAHKRAWFARKTYLRHFAEARLGDLLTIHTWVSDYRRVQSHREYDLRRADGTPILRGRTNWVYVDTETLRPVRLPEDFYDAFQPSGTLETLETGVTDFAPLQAPSHESFRTVQVYEIDSAAHVNNSVYVAWAQQAVHEAVRDLSLTYTAFGREIEYFRGAQPDEPLRIVCQLVGTAETRMIWRTEIFSALTGERLALDLAAYSLAAPLSQAQLEVLTASERRFSS